MMPAKSLIYDSIMIMKEELPGHIRYFLSLQQLKSTLIAGKYCCQSEDHQLFSLMSKPFLLC